VSGQSEQSGGRQGEAVHLTVLPHSGKVEQLKDELAAGRGDPVTPASAPAGLPPIRTATDPGHAPSTDPNAPPELKLLEGKVIEAIRQVYDPEIPVNIYELGLIYEIKVNDDRTVKVRMTLTAPACPVAGSLPGEVEQKIEAVPEVKSAEVELVWDPPWHRGMMSEAAMLQLGML
jgi:FeS assembly SUF system protein